MQKRASRSFFIILFLTFIFCFTKLDARAANGIGISASLSPSEFSGAGKAEIEVDLTNNSDSVLENISLSVGSVSDRVLGGTIEPGQSRSFKISNFSIDESQVGQNMQVVVKYDEGGQRRSSSYSLKVKRIGEVDETPSPEPTPTPTEEPTPSPTPEPAPSLSASRRANKTIGQVGDKITITYVIENTGNTDLMDIKLSDSLANSPIASNFSLPAQSGRKTFEHTFELNEAVKSSSRVVAYTGSGQEVIINLNSLSFDIAQPKIEITAIQSPSQENAEKDTISMDITVKNSGNIDMNKITLTDEKDRSIGEPIELDSGKEVVINYKADLKENRSFVVNANAEYGDDGEKVTFSSTPVELIKEFSPADIKLSLESSTSSSTLTEPGSVLFDLKITNQSPVELYDIKISSNDSYATITIPVLPIDGVQEQQIPVDIDSDKEVIFSANFKDINGMDYNEVSNAQSINIIPVETEAPKEEETLVVDVNAPVVDSWLMPSLDLILLFLGLIVLIVGSIIGLIHVSKLQKRSHEEDIDEEELTDIKAERKRQKQLLREREIEERELLKAKKRALKQKSNKSDSLANDTESNKPTKPQNNTKSDPDIDSIFFDAVTNDDDQSYETDQSTDFIEDTTSVDDDIFEDQSFEDNDLLENTDNSETTTDIDNTDIKSNDSGSIQESENVNPIDDAINEPRTEQQLKPEPDIIKLDDEKDALANPEQANKPKKALNIKDFIVQDEQAEGSNVQEVNKEETPAPDNEVKPAPRPRPVLHKKNDHVIQVENTKRPEPASDNIPNIIIEDSSNKVTSYKKPSTNEDLFMEEFLIEDEDE